MDDKAPFNSLDGLCKWAADLGYKGIQIPTWENRLIDLTTAGESKTYCDELKGKVNDYGLEITELSTHLQGQLVAVHPAYDLMFDNFAPDDCKNNPKKRTEWARKQVISAAHASKHLGLDVSATFSGSLLWHTMHPWPQRPAGLVEMGFEELAKRWLPILNTYDECGVDVAYEIHPGEDLHDGVTFERFLEATGNHKRCNILYDPSHFVLQQLDYIAYIDHYHEFIKAFHVKDSEFKPDGKRGTFGGYSDWQDRAGRYRSPGDGQIDFKTIFTKLTEYGCDVWAVMEWECCVKSPEQGAREGAPFIASHIIEATQKRFDDFAGEDIDKEQLKKILGL
nr:AP endonuclease [uncultured bacterium]